MTLYLNSGQWSAWVIRKVRDRPVVVKVRSSGERHLYYRMWRASDASKRRSVWRRSTGTKMFKLLELRNFRFTAHTSDARDAGLFRLFGRVVRTLKDVGAGVAVPPGDVQASVVP